VGGNKMDILKKDNDLNSKKKVFNQDSHFLLIVFKKTYILNSIMVY
jgi:hypothetical protein